MGFPIQAGISFLSRAPCSPLVSAYSSTIPQWYTDHKRMIVWSLHTCIILAYNVQGLRTLRSCMLRKCKGVGASRLQSIGILPFRVPLPGWPLAFGCNAGPRYPSGRASIPRASLADPLPLLVFKGFSLPKLCHCSQCRRTRGGYGE